MPTIDPTEQMMITVGAKKRAGKTCRIDQHRMPLVNISDKFQNSAFRSDA